MRLTVREANLTHVGDPRTPGFILMTKRFLAEYCSKLCPAAATLFCGQPSMHTILLKTILTDMCLL